MSSFFNVFQTLCCVVIVELPNWRLRMTIKNVGAARGRRMS